MKFWSEEKNFTGVVEVAPPGRSASRVGSPPRFGTSLQMHALFLHIWRAGYWGHSHCPLELQGFIDEDDSPRAGAVIRNTTSLHPSSHLERVRKVGFETRSGALLA